MKNRNWKWILLITIGVLLISGAYSLFIGNEYAVTFDTKGGTFVETQYVKTGEKVVLPEPPTKEGYRFIEWQQDGKTFDFSTEVRDEITLTALWQKIGESDSLYYEVTFMDGEEMITTQYIFPGGLVTEPESPTKEGYTFKGWYYHDKLFDFTKYVSQDIVLEAKWDKI